MEMSRKQWRTSAVVVAAAIVVGVGCSASDQVHVVAAPESDRVVPAVRPYSATVSVREERGDASHEYEVEVDFRSVEDWTATFHDASRYRDGIRVTRTPGRYLYEQPSYDPHDLLNQEQIDAAVAKLSPDQWQAALAELIDSGKLEYRLRTVSDERRVSRSSYDVPADLPILAVLAHGAETWARDNKLTGSGSPGGGRVYKNEHDRLDVDSAGRPTKLSVEDAPDGAPISTRTDYTIKKLTAT